MKISKITIFFKIALFILIANISYSQELDCIDTTLIDTVNMRGACIKYTGYHPLLFGPVCGCDSMTYSSFLCATYHGVTEYTDGACSCIEPSFIDTSMDLIDRILYIKDTDPVRGCDGKYYPTPEIAVLYGGVTSFTRDSIPCVVDTYIDSTLDLSMYPDRSVCGCDKRNYRNKLEAFFYGGILSWKDHKCNCIEKFKIDTTVVCPDNYDPVCGCDRVTYQNQCIAENHYGVQYTKPGECPCVDSTLILSDSVLHYKHNLFLYPFIDMVCGCDSVTYANEVAAQYIFGISRWTKGPCKCVDSTEIDENIPCPSYYYPVIGCDSNFYENPCIAHYRYGVMSVNPAPCFLEQLIDTTVECNPHFNYDPVCGVCDGDTITFPNECYAKYRAGFTRYYYGECLNDSVCVDTFLIDTFKYCSDFYDPVCGCDSITYTNECIAKYRYGVKKWKKGKCTTSNSNINKGENVLVKIYPNPFVNRINFMFDVDNIPESIEILDIYGNKIHKKIIKNKSVNQTIYFDSAISGIYLINLKFKNRLIVKKIVKSYFH